MKKIAIIPARSGSKGLKDKNIIKVCGKPLMSYSIEAAINSKCLIKLLSLLIQKNMPKLRKIWSRSHIERRKVI